MKKRCIWAKMSKNFGHSSAFGVEIYSLNFAPLIIEKLIGDSILNEGVDLVIAGGEGAELARTVIRYVHPPRALKYAFNRYSRIKDPQKKLAAAELVSHSVDIDALQYARVMLEDPISQVVVLGIRLVENISYHTNVKESDLLILLKQMSKHSCKEVRAEVRRVTKSIRQR